MIAMAECLPVSILTAKLGTLVGHGLVLPCVLENARELRYRLFLYAYHFQPNPATSQQRAFHPCASRIPPT